MERLGVDFIDLVHLHDFEYRGGAYFEQAFGEGVSTLAALKEEGRTGSVERNLAWFREPLDPDLLGAVQTILEPVMDKQWPFDV